MADASVETTATIEAEPVKEKVNTENKPSPAQDLRNLQMLLVSGIYPGNVAPQVVAGYNLLEKMCVAIEAGHEKA